MTCACAAAVLTLRRRRPHAQPPRPTFSVASGPCTTTVGGACFRSPNYPDGYGASDCAITVAGAGFVRATTFDTVYGNDYVSVGGVQYSGDGKVYTNGGALSTGGALVSDGSSIAWHAGNPSNGRFSGVEICGVTCDEASCGQHGSCSASGTDCVCADGWSGDTCNVRTASGQHLLSVFLISPWGGADAELFPTCMCFPIAFLSCHRCLMASRRATRSVAATNRATVASSGA